MRRFRPLICIFLCLLVSVFLLPEQALGAELPQARDITGFMQVENEGGFENYRKLFDKDDTTPSHFSNHSRLRLSFDEGIGSLYLVFHFNYGTYTVTDNHTGKTAEFGTNGYLHEFLNLTEAFGETPRSVTLSFDNGTVKLNELMAFTEGQPPESVQIWEPPAEGNTDLLLFSAHGDDEQLFFAGILPYFAGELEYNVQVVYLTDHRTTQEERVHEMLNGLYAVGVRRYPVFGEFYDQRAGSGEIAYQLFSFMGIKKEEVIGFMVEQLRRFKPMVAVTHDINGEYGHGQHELCADMMMQAVELTNDPTQYPEQVEKYGLWDVPKTYLHLYWENEMVMDFDKPLEKFDGMTAYQVCKYIGFPCHKGQYGDFIWYLDQSDVAAEIELYNPCYYGLYRSTVGPDVQKNDFFENLTSYSQQALDREEDALRQQVSQVVHSVEMPALTLTIPEILAQGQGDGLQNAKSGSFLSIWLLIPVVILIIVLLAAYICYRMAFYAPRKKKKANSDEIEIPIGEIYERFRPDMERWAREVRAMDYEDLTIRSFDGLTLHGRYYEFAPGAPIELMFHGYRGTVERDLPGGVQRCFMLGHSALLVDQRCSGQSGGHVITFGIREHRDCHAWVEHMVEHFGPDVKIILTGISMGAATVLMAAGKPLPDNVMGVLADCGFSSPKDIIQVVLGKMGLPPALCYPFVKLGARIFGGFDLEEFSPTEAMRSATKPVIFFHGEDDDFVPCYMSLRMYNACASRKRLVTVPGAGHGLSFPIDQESYLKAAREFFSEEIE